MRMVWTSLSRRFPVRARAATVALLAVGVLAAPQGHAASDSVALRPTADGLKANVVAVTAQESTRESDLWQSVDDGVNYAASDRRITRVQTPAGTSSGYHETSYSTAPAGAVSQVTAHVQARRTEGSVGAVQVQLFGGAGLIGTGARHELGAAWEDLSDTFGGLNVADARQLRARVLLSNTGAEGRSMYTMIWLDATYGAPSTAAPAVSITTPPSGSTVSGVVTVSGTASAPAGLAGVDVTIDGRPVVASGTSSWSYRWDTAGLSGVHVIAVRARDADGRSATASASVTVSAAAGGGGGGPVGTRTNWPCQGCITHVPQSYDPKVPTVLLVALHGDEGVSSYVASVWTPPTDRANVILFAPQCPTDKGCRFADGQGGYTNSWWAWLQYSSGYDDSWLGNQVKTIEASYTVDRSREYLTGWSGGADYLGYYALLHSDRFAAAGFVAGGVPYVQRCPNPKMAAYFLMGSADFRYQSGQPSQVKRVYDSCGDPTSLVVVPGADHQGTINALSQGYATQMLNWFAAHPRAAA